MAAKDRYHDAIKNTLTKDGWTIAFDPYPIKYQEVKLLADLAGEKTISAIKEEKQIVVEIKSFIGRSPMREFETALGQYLIYQTFLSITHPKYQVSLAISFDSWKSLTNTAQTSTKLNFGSTFLRKSAIITMLVRRSPMH